MRSSSIDLTAPHESKQLKGISLISSFVRWARANKTIRVDRIEAREAVVKSDSINSLIGDFHAFLHELRSYELRGIPKGARIFLSAGCSGAWYFDWIKSNYGPVEKHIGVEYYSPKPEGLSPEVEWVASTVQDMHGIESRSVDLVFSGQNIEHLWPDEVCGFLIEANRLVKDNGVIVLDSPNREITELLCWSHPEHTVELTVSEIVDLLRLAGFDSYSRRGVWLCRDPVGKNVFPLSPANAEEPWPLFRRLVVQHERPEDSFCWWVEAKKVGPVDEAALRRRMNEIFSVAYPERINRLTTIIGTVLERPQGRCVSNAGGETGVLIYGPYMPLRRGKYAVGFNILLTGKRPTDRDLAICQVYVSDERILAQKVIHVSELDGHGGAKVLLTWELDETVFGVQFRLIVVAPVVMEADFQFDLRSLQ